TEAGVTRSDIASVLTQSLGAFVDARSRRRVGGGSISECWRFESGRGPVFVKISREEEAEALEAEAAGLEALRRAEAVRVPKVLALGRCTDGAFLALEWIE